MPSACKGVHTSPRTKGVVARTAVAEAASEEEEAGAQLGKKQQLKQLRKKNQLVDVFWYGM